MCNLTEKQRNTIERLLSIYFLHQATKQFVSNLAKELSENADSYEMIKTAVIRRLQAKNLV